ncbi:hypothetical protein FACS1894120_1150 [Clostridia bacterium]|nr:hypothetical protein FACS1894120_1150 [Clostridia bacterium]
MYDQNPAKYNTMHGYPLPEFRYYPADEQSHLEFLKQEHATRMQFPIGNEIQHIKQIAKRMAAINANQEIVEKPQSKAVQKKPKIADKLEKAIEKSKSQTPKKSAKTKKKQEEL